MPTTVNTLEELITEYKRIKSNSLNLKEKQELTGVSGKFPTMNEIHLRLNLICLTMEHQIYAVRQITSSEVGEQQQCKDLIDKIIKLDYTELPVVYRIAQAGGNDIVDLIKTARNEAPKTRSFITGKAGPGEKIKFFLNEVALNIKETPHKNIRSKVEEWYPLDQGNHTKSAKKI